jgi:hypothetical protein
MPADGPVFVIGCGRSGTTLLRSVLDGHPRLAVAHEARFIPRLARRRARYEQADGFDAGRLVADLAGNPAITENLGMSSEDLLAALDGGEPVAGYPDAVDRIFTAYAQRFGKQRWGDKMPGYVLQIPLLASLFPAAQFVHIVRDGRDVALSTLALDDVDEDLAMAACNWRQRVTTGRRDGAALGSDRYQEVRYEDLVDDGQATVRMLCGFLGLPYDEAMLAVPATGTSPARLLANPRHARLHEPVSRGPRSWRTHMERADVALFEAIAGPVLTRFGYERAAPRPGFTVRLRALWARARWQLARARSRRDRSRPGRTAG